MKPEVLITGVAGFIGSHLAQRLLHAGCQVIGLDNFDDYYSVSLKKRNLSLIEKPSGFQFIEGDIRDESLINGIFSDHDIRYILHLAAKAGVRPSIDHPLLYQDVNVRGTLNLLQSCRSRGVEKFIFTSSSSVYGLNCAAPFLEDAVINCPISPYAASKASAELFCRTYHYLYNLPVIILRLFTVYGPRQRPEMAIYRFTDRIEHNQEISIFGDGTSNRDYTYVDDVIDGLVSALQYPGSQFQIFNIGGGRTTSLNHLLKIIEQTLNKEAKIKYLGSSPGDMPVTIADISKARSLLGYQPKVEVSEGISRFVQWYLKDKDLL